MSAADDFLDDPARRPLVNDADHASETPSAGSPSSDEDSLHDAWLDAALRGTMEDPAAFCARHGLEGSDLQARLETLLGLLVTAGPAASPESSRDAAPEAPPPTGSSLVADPDLPRERVGGYRLLRVLGEGGMGVVYLAEQQQLGRLVALKLIRPELSASPTAVTRFRREARAIARLRHPHVVTVLDAGEDDAMLWFAMELIPGRSLTELLADATAPLPVRRVVGWGRDLARALDAAHREGIVHRDVKPGNVRVTSDDRALLLDFGLARDLTGTDATITASFAGSPAYAAPEQLSGDAVDGRTDVYALGVTLYQALTGRVPFEADSLTHQIHALATEDPPPPRSLRPDLPRDLETVVSMAIEREPARRYASAAALADDLDAVLALRPVSAMPPAIGRRMAAWVRGHRAIAASILAVTLAGAATLVTSALEDAAARRADAREAARLVGHVQEQLAAYAEGRATADGAMWTRRTLYEALGSRRLTADEIARLDEADATAKDRDGSRERLVGQVLGQLAEARRLDSSAPGLEQAWASYYTQRWLDVRGGNVPEAEVFFRDQVIAHDPDGTWSQRVRGTAPVSFHSSPKGATVHLFRYREQGDVGEGNQRALVTVPVTEISEAGTRLATRPERPGPVRSCRLGTTPLEHLQMPPGWYLAWFALPGRVSQVVPFHVDHAVEEYAGPLLLSPRLLEPREVVPGFVRVAADAYSWGERAFFVQRREVTAAEYAAFVTDLAGRDEEAAAARLPASTESDAWRLSGSAGLVLPDGVLPEHPVLGVSWDDAMAYARWWDGARNPRPSELWADLPTVFEWSRAGHGGDGRDYPFGDVFRPAWTSSRFGTEQLGPSAVGSHPVDCSTWGALDMAGSAREWLADEQDGGRRLLAGGGWDESDPRAFRVERRESLQADTRARSTGFRLVLRERDVPMKDPR